ncbi:hypothetical protein J2X11_001222 [Aeromicrobium panaciterrae]|uniref:Uncharacterized protein n=1 Tax=Aeromicrobium panaciterrae TaxID=363861 RepID=A0ABU1UMJ7_9ACTN|nr:hypothetical protein [Aeromicrobium panaciterrae]MDR7086383.1 hypothetical protein [Aeromicrobium panaciterrae]
MSFVPLEHAVRDGRSDIAVVARGVGARAAQMGVPLHEVMDHVERAHAPEEPPFATVRAAALAWVEEALVHQVDASCEHPLTALSTVPHVRSRLGDVYRGAERDGTRAADGYALVVVELPRLDPGNELEQELRSLEVAEAMRMVYAGDETIAQLSPRRFAALAGIERTDAVTVRLLAMMLEQVLGDESQARLWVEHLPSTSDGIATMLAGLTT